MKTPNIQLECRVLSSITECNEYAHLTIPSLRFLIRECTLINLSAPVEPGQVVAIGCSIKARESRPVGLIFGIVQLPDESTAKLDRPTIMIASIEVDQNLQGLGIARIMWDRLRSTALEVDIASLLIDIPIEERVTPALIALASEQSGWTIEAGPILGTISIKQSDQMINMLQSAALRGKNHRLFRTTPLLELIRKGPPSRLQRLTAEELPSWARIFHKGTDLDDIDEHASLCLWSGNDLVGWILCEWVDERRLRVSSLWLNQAYRRAFPAAVLMHDALLTAGLPRRMTPLNPSGLSPEFITFGFSKLNTGMSLLARNKLKPFCQHWVITERRKLWL